jgi:hypothetical protein
MSQSLVEAPAVLTLDSARKYVLNHFGKRTIQILNTQWEDRDGGAVNVFFFFNFRGLSETSEHCMTVWLESGQYYSKW